MSAGGVSCSQLHPGRSGTLATGPPAAPEIAVGDAY